MTRQRLPDCRPAVLAVLEGEPGAAQLLPHQQQPHQRQQNCGAGCSSGSACPTSTRGVLPYLKQYGIGGPNSVRAFAARGIGPGTYRPVDPSANSNSGFYDQVGDIRLEGNVEYRQDLFPYVKGAVFMDAGNIWLVNRDASRATYNSEGQPRRPERAVPVQHLPQAAGCGRRRRASASTCSSSSSASTPPCPSATPTPTTGYEIPQPRSARANPRAAVAVQQEPHRHPALTASILVLAIRSKLSAILGC